MHISLCLIIKNNRAKKHDIGEMDKTHRRDAERSN